jgi:hypothetical protein
MEFVLGLLGIIQITLLPGLIAYRFFRIRTNLLDKVLIVFGLSLITNYCAIFLLSLLGIYTRTTLSILTLGEIVAILWLYRRELAMPSKRILEAGQEGIREMVRLFLPERQQSSASILYYFIVLVLLLLSAWSILWAINLFYRNLGTVFSAWDAVVSWNRWATTWATSLIPRDSNFYPQLIPANWSITYILLGSTALQFFAKGIMPLFTLMILLGLFNLVLVTKKYYFLVSIVLLQPLLNKLLETGLTNGYPDSAVAFFAFASLYMLLKAQVQPEPGERSQLYLLGALFSMGAAITKQTGVYMALCYPVLVASDAYFTKQPLEKKQIRTWIVVFAGISMVWVSWYIFNALAGTGSEVFDTYISVSEGKFDNLPLLERIAAALGQHKEFIFLFLLIAVTFPWMDRFHQTLTLLFAPYPLLWAWVASYDTRNLAIFLPVLALVSGYAIDKLIRKLTELSEKAKILQTPIYIPVLIACLGLVSLGVLVSPQTLHQKQVELQRQIFSPSKNQMLLDLVSENGPQTKILTNYPMDYIPGLEKNQVRFNFQDYDLFLSYLQNPEIAYLLVPNGIDKRTADYIDRQVNAGNYEVIFKDKQWKVFTLFKILKKE